MKPDRQIIERAVPLVDLEVGGEDGRTVTAYAATFGEAYGVVDFDGDYDEVINRSAFDRTLSHGIAGRVQPLFNHGRTLAGTPSDRYSMPLGTPVSVTAEAKGLLTVTRYAKTDLAEEVLELIRSGAITAQSFRGPIYRSRHSVVAGRDRIERVELGLRDYGPAPFAVNTSAQILAVRSALLAERLETLGDLTDEERAELAAALATPGTPTEPADESAPPEGSPAPTDTLEEPAGTAPPAGPSIDTLALEAAQRRRRA